MYFCAHALHDGTVVAAYPIRKPSPQELRDRRIPIDPEGVAREFAHVWKDISVDNQTRTRFQSVIATDLNTRRALRELVLPALDEALEKIQALQSQLDRMEAMLISGTGRAVPEAIERVVTGSRSPDRSALR